MSTLLDASVVHYLEQIRIPVRLAFTTESGWPLLVSLWYLLRDGRLYCATQQTARVVAHLTRDPQCAFEVSADQPPYCGVRGQGISTIDPGQGESILVALLERYLGSTDTMLAQNLLAKRHTEVAIVIEPVRLFTWNFTDRMRDALHLSEPGEYSPCPE